MPWVHPAQKHALLNKYRGSLDETPEEEQAALAAAAAARPMTPLGEPQQQSAPTVPGAEAAMPRPSAPAKKLSVVAATAELLDHLRAGRVEAALDIALPFDHALTPKKPSAIAESAAIVYPLAVSLREAGHVELAARYVQRYGLHECPVCSLGATTGGGGGGGASGDCAGESGCRSLPLRVLVGDLVNAGNFDAVFRLSADARLSRPPHSLAHHYPPALLLKQALAQPRFAFVRGVESTQRWELPAHVPLLRRWIVDEIEQAGLGGQGGWGSGRAAVASTTLAMAVSALLDGTHCRPPALAAAASLQLGCVSAATATLSLPEAHRVPALLQQLAESEPKAALELLRKWYPIPPKLGGSARKPAAKQQRPSGSVVWSADDFGVHPTIVIRQLLRKQSGSDGGGGGGGSSGSDLNLLSAMCSVEHIAHFGMQASFPQVLQRLLAADEIEAAVKFSHGGGPGCIAAQATTLAHVARTDPLPLSFPPAAPNAAVAAAAGDGRDMSDADGGNGYEEEEDASSSSSSVLRPGGNAALLAVAFNPIKKSTLPSPEHSWTLRDSSWLRLAELGNCAIVVVDCPEALGKAESVLQPLLKQAAAAVAARQKKRQQQQQQQQQQHGRHGVGEGDEQNNCNISSQGMSERAPGGGASSHRGGRRGVCEGRGGRKTGDGPSLGMPERAPGGGASSRRGGWHAVEVDGERREARDGSSLGVPERAPGRGAFSH